MTSRDVLTVFRITGLFIAFVLVIDAAVTFADSGVKCWHDKDPPVPLDFEFLSAIDGHPSRCGYVQPTVTMIRVLGDTPRTEYTHVMCVPLERVACPK